MTKTKAIDKPGTAQQSQLARAFDVINALIKATQPMKLKALAEVTRLDASGTLRLLKTLVVARATCLSFQPMLHQL